VQRDPKANTERFRPALPFKHHDYSGTDIDFELVSCLNVGLKVGFQMNSPGNFGKGFLDGINVPIDKRDLNGCRTKAKVLIGRSDFRDVP